MFAVDLDRVRADQPPVAGDQVEAHVAETVGVVVALGDLGLHGPDAVPHLRPVDDRLDRLDAEVVGRAHVVGHLRGGQQRLAGHAAGPETVAAHPVPLDHGDPEVEGGGELGGDHAPRAHTHDHEVVPVGHLDATSSAPRPRATLERVHRKFPEFW